MRAALESRCELFSTNLCLRTIVSVASLDGTVLLLEVKRARIVLSDILQN